MTANFWKDKYPAGIPAEINPDQYPNILAVLKESCQRFAAKPAFSSLGKTLTYAQVYELSGAFAAYLHSSTPACSRVTASLCRCRTSCNTR